jgi:hypothetical protein
VSIKKVEVYQTPDGEQFSTLKRAEEHLDFLQVSKRIEEWVEEYLPGNEYGVSDQEEIERMIDQHWEPLFNILLIRSRKNTRGKASENHSVKELHAFYNTKLLELGLSTRVCSTLIHRGPFKYVGDLIALSDRELRKIRDIGPTSLSEIRSKLAPFELGMPLHGWVRPDLSTDK